MNTIKIINKGNAPGENKVRETFSELEIRRCRNEISLCITHTKIFHGGKKRTNYTFFDIPENRFKELIKLMNTPHEKKRFTCLKN